MFDTIWAQAKIARNCSFRTHISIRFLLRSCIFAFLLHASAQNRGKYQKIPTIRFVWLTVSRWLCAIHFSPCNNNNSGAHTYDYGRSVRFTNQISFIFTFVVKWNACEKHGKNMISWIYKKSHLARKRMFFVVWICSRFFFGLICFLCASCRRINAFAIPSFYSVSVSLFTCRYEPSTLAHIF